MSQNMIIGIDPGKSGGISLLYPDGKIYAYAYKSTKDYAELLRDVAEYARIEGVNVFAFIEELSGFQQGRFQMRGRQCFVMGKTCGELEGLLYAYKIPFEPITPAAWERTLSGVIGVEYTQKKKLLREIAIARFPHLKPTGKTADAILIAEYGANKRGLKINRNN